MLKFSFRNQVLTGFIVSIILVLVVGVLSYKSINQLESDSSMVEHTQVVIKTATNLLQQIIDAETGMRGFVATNKPVFLDPYNTAVSKIQTDISELKELIPDNPVQVRRVDSLTDLVNDQLNIIKTNIATRPDKGLDFMVQNNMLLNGKHNMDAIRALTAHLIGTENDLLAERKVKSQEQSTTSMIIIICGSLIFLIIIVVLFFYIQGTFLQQKKIEEQIKTTNVELEAVLAENRAKNWLLTGSGLLNEKIRGQQSEAELAGNILNEVCSYSDAVIGTFYLLDEETESLKLYASFAMDDLNDLKKTIKIGESWVGQVAKDGKAAIVKGKINDNLKISSSLINQNVIESYVVPFFFDAKLKGVMEIAFDDVIEDQTTGYISNVLNIIGVAINTTQQNTKMKDLLSQVQQQTEELQAQQEEMRITNEELMSKTEMLEASEEELRTQQEELRATNAELEEKASLLEEKNQAIEEARQAINIKVSELETTGKYKSEFLANMSHELRTPLNSILVLARILKDNKPANLSEDQIKYASVIFNAGNDLLNLINDILDLSKIESGKVEMQNEQVKITEVVHDMEMLFAELAVSKKINFTNNIDNNLPEKILTDKTKVEQVLKNLLSNAFKFTPESGIISINVVAGAANNAIQFRIKDSGIGIPLEKQKIIFEAFQQADGSTSRKYGGTGLGLSISRELAGLLGGIITVTSEPGVGSEFVLSLPLKPNVSGQEEHAGPVINFNPVTAPLKSAGQVARKDNKEPFVIIVEDDKNFANILQDYAHQHGYRSVLITEGTDAVELITDNQPDAVILDIMLPGKDGWQILRELKQNPATSEIPVHMMSAGDTTEKKVKKEGAISFLKKPIDIPTIDNLFKEIMLQSGSKFKQILLIEDNKTQSDALNELMKSQGIAVDQAYDGETAFKLMNENDYQCVILDLNLPDIYGLDFLDKIKEQEKFKELPVIINTAMELDKTSVSRLMQYANAMVVKTNKSADRLIDEVNLFLNKVKEVSESETEHPVLAKSKNMMLRKEAIKGKKVLIVDDDMRNIFALSSALESYDMIVEVATDGIEAIEKVESVPDLDIVLMDIMMPRMDGYEAMTNIRAKSKYSKLPIIALTAKAMADDREKCIAAGANDYITKPVDIDRLISLMQLWMAK